ncbi:hypothetical protein K438DRAFT_1765942 [Mycena galopus ATCC 62051]|nr:hypothetical protein K438DRAFT_1765942 [Mycena galopus ATCC 62051]
MTNSMLTAIPADIHYHLLGMLSDFHDLGATILTHRCFHAAYNAGKKTVLDNVGRNFLGCLFDQALFLARAQERMYGSGNPPTEELSAKTVALIVNNDPVLRSLEPVVFGFLKADKQKFKRISSAEEDNHKDLPLLVGPTPTESLRFMGAGYRFWRFVLQREKNRIAFLQNLAPSKLLELNHFVTGMTALIWLMWGREAESDHDNDFVSGVLSTGPDSILCLWEALQDAILNEDFEEFEDQFGIAGGSMEEGFFSYAYYDVTESKGLDKIPGLVGFRPIEPIFDEDNKKMRQLLKEFGETGSKKTTGSKDVQS